MVTSDDSGSTSEAADLVAQSPGGFVSCCSGHLGWLIADTEEMHAHGDIDRESHPGCHQRNQSRGDINREGDPKAPADVRDGLINIEASAPAARDRLDQHVERCADEHKRCAVEG